ncbi:DgyrCDS9836 [Dimorphilus gyrociliatus]|uniref:DgyrCDS9836 n=1 Tax=Dimorphilus gyrociliatus TaxID=2664684 RepID=A0A7I8W0W4_9ANNE|nr:DgyrCDS9836 [Dimorphilus gyrociliatus]
MRKLKLKEDGICRIFFSSPFNGMEEERELAKKFWPKIQAFCNFNGIQFRAVDMRWGITTQNVAEAKVIDICLQECSRSDIFIGFYGQRYGWHGVNDRDLQENFERSKIRFPWINSYRDRSITELEFIAGHLNCPGAIPACICFRDISYDNEKYEKAKNDGNNEKMKAFSVESANVKVRLQDLKKRVTETRDKTIGIHMSYKTPLEGVEFMSSSILRYLSENVCKEHTKLSPRELSLCHHDNYATAKSKSFFGRKDILKRLFNTKKNVVLTGEAGCGKSAIIATWRKMLEIPSILNTIIISHFVECKDKMSAYHILERVNLELLLAMQSKGYDIGKGFIRNGSNLEDHMRELLSMLDKLKTRDENCVIIIDGLNRIAKKEQTAKTLGCIPNFQLKNLQIILATLSSDTENIEELKMRGYEEIKVPPLDEVSKLNMCLVCVN